MGIGDDWIGIFISDRVMERLRIEHSALPVLEMNTLIFYGESRVRSAFDGANSSVLKSLLIRKKYLMAIILGVFGCNFVSKNCIP